jgi:hypothetical protein
LNKLSPGKSISSEKAANGQNISKALKIFRTLTCKISDFALLLRAQLALLPMLSLTLAPISEILLQVLHLAQKVKAEG